MRGSLDMPGWASTRGNDSRVRKIDEDKAQQVLDAKPSGKTQREVAELLGVSVSIVGQIWRRQRWRHLKATQAE